MVFASIINIVLSIYAGYKFGLVGILFATIIARLCTNLWFEPYKLHKTYFSKSPKEYFIKQIAKLVLLIVIICVINLITNAIVINNPILDFGFKIILCITIPNIIFALLFRKTEEFNYIYNNIVKKTLSGVYNKVRK